MDLTMYMRLLPAPLVITNFVKGDNACNYEKYLLELLNASPWFSAKYPGGFTAPPSESHGECDANNPHYRIDFKLLASKTALQARSMQRLRKRLLPDGVTIYSASQGTKINATRIYAAFRKRTLKDPHDIHAYCPKAQGVQNDIGAVLKVMEIEKNLLLFFPYVFSFDKPRPFDEAASCIGAALTNDFHAMFEYRNSIAQNHFDTFLTCVYEQHFLIYQVQQGALLFIEAIQTQKCETFSHLSQCPTWPMA